MILSVGYAALKCFATQCSNVEFVVGCSCGFIYTCSVVRFLMLVQYFLHKLPKKT